MKDLVIFWRRKKRKGGAIFEVLWVAFQDHPPKWTKLVLWRYDL